MLVLKRVAELYNSLLGPEGEAGTPAAFGSLAELVDAESAYAGSHHADGDRGYWEQELHGAPPPRDWPAGPTERLVPWFVPSVPCRRKLPQRWSPPPPRPPRWY